MLWRVGALIMALITRLMCSDALAQEPSSAWKAGVASSTITPTVPQWMAGYGGRDHEAEGKLTELYAKALAVEDAAGERAVIISLDLCGIDRDFSLAVRARLEAQFGLALRQVALCCSHTHCGPVVGGNLMAMYFLSPEQEERVRGYTKELEEKVVAVAGQALANLQACRLSWAKGCETFAVNRRNNVEAEVPRLRAAGQLVGPVDYEVPVLAVRSPEGHVLAVLFGYACHATVMDFYLWSGDYPGFAQAALEEAYPGAAALFIAGCGGDQNPLPRRRPELAEEYGRRLAAAVGRTLEGVMVPVEGRLHTAYTEVDLPFDRLPTREELVEQTAASDRYLARRAKLLLAQIDSGQPLSQTYPYPVQVWQLGTGPTLVLLGGEVVVDYSLRLKAMLGEAATWVAAYANDVMAYIPSRQVLLEGGYEGGGAMVYYGLPTTWSPDVEQTVVHAVQHVYQQTR